jgi:hypothetical protein
LSPLAAFCWTEGISLLVVKSYGLIGSVRLQLNGHNIIESKTEGDAFDLRIAEPFPELEAYCNSIHLEELDSLQHGHVPYIAILYNAIQSWRAQVCECSTVQLLLQCLRISSPPVLSAATAVVGQVDCCKLRAVQSYIKC